MDFILPAITQGLGYTGLGLGIYLSLKVFNIPDITTDGSYTLGGAVTAVALSFGIHPLLVIPAAMLGGAIAGATTGWIHTRLNIHPLLAGILVMTGLYSVNLLIMSRPNIPLMDVKNIFALATLTGDRHRDQFLMLAGITLLIFIMLVWLLKTDFGIAMRATGNSETMIRALGVDTRAMKIKGLAAANALTALSGNLLVQYQGFADINMGIGIVISGLGAVIIGEAIAQLIPYKSLAVSVAGVIAGTIVFRILLAFALSLGLPPNLLKLVTALIVLSTVGLLQYFKKNRGYD